MAAYRSNAGNSAGPGSRAFILPTPENVRAALSYISPDLPHGEWVRVAMAVHDGLNGQGYEIFDTWSQSGQTYKSAAVRDTWKSIKSGGGVTVGTLWGMALDKGWKPEGEAHQETEAERLERERKRKEQAERDAKDKARKEQEAARKAKALWKAATPLQTDHPYFSRKLPGIAPPPTLREIPADHAAEILGYAPQSDGEPLAGRLIVAPVKIDNKLTTAELIDESGRKSAIAGGPKRGGYWAAQPLPQGDGAGLTFLIGEGVATALSAQAASGHPALAALSSGNLANLAGAMRRAYPAAAIVVLADLLKASGEPDPNAIEAAQAVGGRLAVPNFGSDRPAECKDFNDLHQAQGLNAVRVALAEAASPDAPQPTEPPPRRGLFGGPLRDPADVGRKTAKPPPAEPPQTITANTLQGVKFEPLRWVIPGIVPEGVALLVGAPKIGKSWVCLDWCIAVASGGDVFGSIAGVEPGESLYLALEDNKRRIQRRLSTRLQDTPWPEKMHICCEWPRMDAGGVESLRVWLEEHPGCRLVVIDTLAMFRPPTSAKKSVYEQDHAFGAALLKLAADFHCAIVIVHHNNKSKAEDVLETISGSQGLAGGVDNVLVMRRARFTAGAELHVTGRDIEDEQVYQLAFDKTSCSWRLFGSGQESLLPRELKNIVNLLKDKGPLTGKEITQLLHPGLVVGRTCKEWTAVRKNLIKLRSMNFVIETEDGKQSYNAQDT